MEQWVRIPEFPSYGVSNLGRVSNIRREKLLTPVVNQRGIAVICFFEDGKRTSRSLARLVAEGFVKPQLSTFNAPINLNGDRTDCRVENILWRPRWHAVFYHRQFSMPEFYETDTKIELLETGEIFDGWKEPSVQYGLRYIDVILSFLNQRVTFPIWKTFRRL